MGCSMQHLLIYIISFLCLSSIFTFDVSLVSAQENVLENSKTIFVIPVKNGNVDQSVLRKFDTLVPELKRISQEKIIKLECRYFGQPRRERDVMIAYQIAGKIEKYLREKHKLNLDLWISIRLNQHIQKTPTTLTIAVFADDIKRLDSTPIDPAKTE